MPLSIYADTANSLCREQFSRNTRKMSNMTISLEPATLQNCQFLKMSDMIWLLPKEPV